MNDLLDVIATWFDGHSTTNMVVWGWPMLVWGRVGKVMLYFAALSIVLDLLDPDKLRERGGGLKVRATDALSHARLRLSQAGVAGLSTSIRRHFISITPGISYDQWGITGQRGDRHSAVYTPPEYVPRALGCSLEEYQAFHQSVIAELPRVHSCDGEHDDLSSAQRDHIQARIDAFLTEHVPSDQRRYMKAIRSWLLAKAAWWALMGAAETLLGAILHRTRPLHVFRWAAFALVLVGGPLDMLAA
ncbi:hypothetical protein ACIBO5_24135 [Nonomuraea angiospora]|uniref:hypothetical protein n=1 Tax=Nonomuraea angiospora TaxID=46172 RepID=UPI0029B7A88A|nr:hypothetical protein [Nonomuraea angiospora]MDX3101681.1 hypothetical protein [Nonomuraea angiospora]